MTDILTQFFSVFDSNTLLQIVSLYITSIFVYALYNFIR